MPYICKSCGHTSRSYKQNMKHIESMHQDMQVIHQNGNIQNHDFQGIHTRLDDVDSVTGEIIFGRGHTCKKCKARFAYMLTYEEHLDKCDPLRKVKDLERAKRTCICGQEFATHIARERHNKICNYIKKIEAVQKIIHELVQAWAIEKDEEKLEYLYFKYFVGIDITKCPKPDMNSCDT